MAARICALIVGRLWGKGDLCLVRLDPGESFSRCKDVQLLHVKVFPAFAAGIDPSCCRVMPGPPPLRLSPCTQHLLLALSFGMTGSASCRNRAAWETTNCLGTSGVLTEVWCVWGMMVCCHFESLVPCTHVVLSDCNTGHEHGMNMTQPRWLSELAL